MVSLILRSGSIGPMCCEFGGGDITPIFNFGNDFPLLLQNADKLQDQQETVQEEKTRPQTPIILSGNEKKMTKRKRKQSDKCEKASKLVTEVNETTTNTVNGKCEKEAGIPPEIPDKMEEDSQVETVHEKRKKKKKWRSVPLEDLGFNLSLLPRPAKPGAENEALINEIETGIERHFDDIDSRIYSPELQELEGQVTREYKYIRPDRHRKIRKAHKQIKDKYCTSVKNNKGRKKLYVNHLLSKQIDILVRGQSYLPCGPKRNRVLDRETVRDLNSKAKSQAPASRPAPVQNLAHALHNSNAPGDIPTDVVSLLITLQHRDLTPEDYETLLRLDERVAPKTISVNVLETFRTDKVVEGSAGDVCPVCMDVYEIGQTRKFLPCNHVFHANCIDMWLKNSSMNCPIDNLPVDS